MGVKWICWSIEDPGSLSSSSDSTSDALSVETNICMASPGPDSLTLRGSVEPAQTFTRGALDAPGQLWTIYGHREHMLAHGLTGLVCIYKSRTIQLCPYG